MNARLEELIEGSERLTSVFGAWPTFHDAEVVELYFERGEVNEARNVFELPRLLVKVLLFDEYMGRLPFEHQSIATILFNEIEGFSMKDFNYQNAIYGLDIEPFEREPTRFKVCFDGAFGMSAEFRSSGIKVLSVIASQRGVRPELGFAESDMKAR
ncbi:MAG TPA: Imm50 family immunity protein [Methylomirabilota bacterium]|nr:Imm50 family immunity protein [Methylomirabilota bacterium]